MAEKNNDLKHYVLTLFLVVLTYVIIFLLSAVKGTQNIPLINYFLPFNNFDSPLYLLMPLVGFFFVFTGLPWAKEFFESNFLKSKFFPIAFILTGMIAFYVMLYFFFIGAVWGTQVPMQICVWDCLGQQQALQQAGLAGSVLFLDYPNELRNSAFVLFLLSGVLGWFSLKVKKIAVEKFF